ncbi:outer membrane family protein [Helicobacter cetorum]|uniref:outer membrane family protein n=1 Tax=Helicobacter cetorum TaxID=138563 RepID=UPI0022352A0C|nr:outer membrane family protein [Helicobacter cetorum]
MSLSLSLLTPKMLQAFDYQFSGFVTQASNIGFNQHKINRAKGIYPTPQYATISGYLGTNFHLIKNDKHILKGAVGGMIGSIFYDGTKKFEDGSVAYDLFGFYEGFLGEKDNVLETDTLEIENFKKNQNVHNYVLSDAFLEYRYKNLFGFKAGRYQSSALFKSAWTQGFEAFIQHKDFRLWWFSSFGRAFAYGAFLMDWYAARKTYSKGYVKNSQGGYTPKGHKTTLGVHALQATYKWRSLFIEGFFYFSPQTFNAPGFKLEYNTSPNFSAVGFRSKTTLIALFPIYYPWMLVEENGTPVYENDTKATQNGQTLSIQQRFDYNQFYTSLTLYKVFQNANTWIGKMGNPTEVLLGGNSIYAGYWGTGIKANAITIALAVGGIHLNKKFSWNFIAQYSSAPVSYEARAVLSLFYTITPYLKASVELIYYGIHTNKGYKAGANEAIASDFPALYSDRSGVKTNLVMEF